MRNVTKVHPEPNGPHGAHRKRPVNDTTSTNANTTNHCRELSLFIDEEEA
jgi:hypothetical protein